MGDMIERVAPGDALQHAFATDHRIKQPAFEPDGFAERGALGAEPPAIGRMVRITCDGGAAQPVRRRLHAAANPAIGAGRAGRGRSEGGIVAHHAAIPMQ